MAVGFCRYCGTRFNGRYGRASVYSHIEYPLEYEASSAHTEASCRDALMRRVAYLEVRERVGNTLRTEVLRVVAALRARDRGTQRGLQWAYDAAQALEDACKPA